MYFSTSFLNIMIIMALSGVAVAAISLIILLIRDIKSKELW